MQSEQTKMIKADIIRLINDNSNTLIPCLSEWIDVLIGSARLDQKQELMYSIGTQTQNISTLTDITDDCSTLRFNLDLLNPNKIIPVIPDTEFFND